MITAPYNFVPLSRFVYFPDWADQISHDIPFSDGVSGTITCKIETLTPVYVRNGGNWERNQILQDPNAQSFFKVGNDYIIPGTSLKGMLRSVLEIISFGKMGRNRVDDYKYSSRDLDNPQYTRKMTDINNPRLYKSNVKAGWLKQDPHGDWYLTPCEYARVEQTDLAAYHGGTIDLHKRQSAKDKYNVWTSQSLDVTFNYSQPAVGWPHQGGAIHLDYKKTTQGSLGSGSTVGKIVFTGQASTTKHMEFIFFNPGTIAQRISDKLQDDFLFIHRDSLKKPVEWNYWQSKLNGGQEIPVFYLGAANNPDSMGLAQMYRLPYKHSILDTIKYTDRDHAITDPDLADTMFGYLDDKGENSLKGRISIGHAVAETGTAQPLGCITKVLGSPKPTYYPNYIKQTTPVAEYKTMMNDNAEIRGWKRYPARKLENVSQNNDAANQELVTKFTPLNAGVSFTFPIRFHNLRPVELGALIWTLTWGGDTTLCHRLGMAKPFGFGQVKITPDESQSKLFNTKREVIHKSTTDYRAIFVNHMKAIEYLPGIQFGGWETCEQLSHLKAMAEPEREPEGTTQSQKLKYMPLPEFSKARKKDRKEILEPHIGYTGAQITSGAQLGSKQKERATANKPFIEIKDPLIRKNIQQMFDEVKSSNNLENIFNFFQKLSVEDLEAFNKLDLKPADRILHIGIVKNLEKSEINAVIKSVIAGKMLGFIEPKKKWDNDKKERYKILKNLAGDKIN